MDGLDAESSGNKQSAAFMEMQQQAALGVAAHHQAYSSLRNSYQNASDAFGGQRGPGGPLGGYSPFAAAMNNSPLHNTYPHHAAVSAQAHHYLTSYPPNVTSCGPPCPSPPRDGKCYSFILSFRYTQTQRIQVHFDTFFMPLGWNRHHPVTRKESRWTGTHTQTQSLSE